MSIGRRDFFKVISAGAVTAATAGSVFAREKKTLAPDAVGILYDATLCIGCKNCERGCKEYNDMPIEQTDRVDDLNVPKIWDNSDDLSSKTLNKIKLYRNGDASVKDRETDGYSFVKRACMHCVDPDCVSACPVTALSKDEVTGIVTYNEKACIGCRYCQVACPFNIPKFEWDDPFPKIVKCQMCEHKQEEGGIPGCCYYCPTGASMFGKVEDLLDEAHRRVQLAEGTYYDYPIRSIDSNQKSTLKAKKYINYVYGEKETGGTQYMILSAVPFHKLGLPTLPDSSASSRSETIQHTVYKGLIAPGALLAGLLVAAYRSNKSHHESEEGRSK